MRVDPWIEALAALDEAERKIQTAKSAINHAIIAQGERAEKVAPDYEACTHECAIPERFSSKVDSCGE